MALEDVGKKLRQSLIDLREQTIGLRTTVVEDRPRKGDVVLIDLCANDIDDLLGWIETALDDTLGTPDKAILAKCHDCHIRMLDAYAALSAHDRIASILQAGRDRKGEWTAWAESVWDAIERLRRPIHEFSIVLLAGWSALADQKAGVAMHNTNIGQQIAAPDRLIGNRFP